MRTLRRTTVAVVREELGLSRQEFADLIGKSDATVSSLENGRLQLSERTALAIHKKTGVRMTWLLTGDPNTPPVNIEGKPWTKEDYEKGAFEFHHLDNPTEEVAKTFATFYNAVLESIFVKQIREDADRASIVITRVEQFLEDLQKEFGTDDKIFDDLLRKARKMPLAQYVESVSSLFPAKTSSGSPSPSNGRPKGGRKSA
jgi:transcriptional regulator with XRE-family HTH domain